MRKCRLVVWAGFVALVLAGCGGSGSSSDSGSEGQGEGTAFACSSGFVGGSTSSSSGACNNCEILESGSAIDGQSGTFASLNFGINGGELSFRATAPAGKTFPGGVEAGALMLFPRSQGGYSNVGVRFNTYLGGSVIDSNAGGTVTGFGNVAGAGEDTFYSVTPSQEVDAIEAIVSLSANTDNESVLVYEFCGER